MSCFEGPLRWLVVGAVRWLIEEACVLVPVSAGFPEAYESSVLLTAALHGDLH